MIEIVDFSLRRFIFCHDLINPPSQYQSSDIDLNFIGSVALSISKEPKVNLQNLSI